MRSVDPGDTFTSWRAAARRLLAERVPPHEVLWERSLFPSDPGDPGEPSGQASRVGVPAAFLALAEPVACHAGSARWPLLYRLLWRITWGGERKLLHIASDPDVATAAAMAKRVRREIHKMHAFVRFKLLATDETSGRERYAAWFEPEHFIVAAGTPFFRERFANMDWSLFTPKGCAFWIGGRFLLAPGVDRNPIETPDALDDIWGTYYRSIFNPARLKTKMMQAEMPKRYWKNLPETAHIPDLIAESRARVEAMFARRPRPPKPAPNLPYLSQLRALDRLPALPIPAATSSLTELNARAAACRACPLWERATCTVFGEGPAPARLMIVGDPPGDPEDLTGRPFLGPGGRLLDRALADAGIDRQSAYLTHAVKHFAWTSYGKTRRPREPLPAEIDACRPWLREELRSVRPETLILLGATAARALLGEAAAAQPRGAIHAPHLARRVVVSDSPAGLLHRPAGHSREEAYRQWIDELRAAALPAIP